MKKLIVSLACISLMFVAACGCKGGNEKHSVPACSAATDSVAGQTEGQVNLSDTISFAFVGDIMMGTVYPSVYLPANEGRHLFDDTKEILQGVDVAAGNLEGPLFDEKAHTTKSGENSYAFRTPGSFLHNLVDAGFDFLGVANNHSNDFGATGRKCTFRNLENAGIKYAGVRGMCETAVIECRGKKIGLTQFGHSAGTLSIMDYEEVKRIVGKLRKECDIVVVGFHGGAEGKGHERVPHRMETAFGERRGDVEKFAHTAIDAGADIVYGHGPHVPRAMESYNGKIVMYSLGNFCTPYRMGLGGISGYAPIVEIKTDEKGNFIGGKIHSFIQRGGVGPRKDENGSVAGFIRKMSTSDFPKSPLRISDKGEISSN